MTDPVRLNCDTCDVRGLACDDCVVTVLLGPVDGCEVAPTVPVPVSLTPRSTLPAVSPPVSPAVSPVALPVAAPPVASVEPAVLLDGETVLDEQDRMALAVFADAGLVPPLRFTERHDEPAVEWRRGA